MADLRAADSQHIIEQFISSPVDVDMGASAGGRADPDGIPMELFQLPPTKD
jgi:hypothetical protein